MHLGGLMFVKALEKSKKEDLRAFITQFKKFLDKQIIIWRLDRDKIAKSWNAKFGNISGFHHQPIDGLPIDPEDEYVTYDEFYINILWQAVRIASVIHDVGHLPFSHVFEHAIEDYQKFDEKKDGILSKELDRRSKELEEELKTQISSDISLTNVQVHEQIGAFLATKLIPLEVPGIDPDISRLAFHLGSLIFLINREEYSADEYEPLACLHTIISSELDADRLDYCIRDPKGSGVEFGAFDVYRILDSLILFKDSKGVFRITPSSKSISAIESFFHQRFLMYKYLLHHHNAARMDGIAQEIIRRLMKIAADSPQKSLVYITLVNYGFWQNGKFKNKFLAKYPYYYYDDTWLRAMMMHLYVELQKDLRLAKGELSIIGKDNWQLFMLLEVLLLRRTSNVFSLWKRDSDYYSLVEDLCAEIKFPNKKEKEKIFEIINMTVLKAYDVWDKFINNMLKDLDRKNIILIVTLTPPKVFDLNNEGDSKLQISFRKNASGNTYEYELMPANKTSPYLDSLIPVTKKIPSFHVSFVHPDIKKTDTNQNNVLQEYCETVFKKNFKIFIEKALKARINKPTTPKVKRAKKSSKKKRSNKL